MQLPKMEIVVGPLCLLLLLLLLLLLFRIISSTNITSTSTSTSTTSMLDLDLGCRGLILSLHAEPLRVPPLLVEWDELIRQPVIHVPVMRLVQLHRENHVTEFGIFAEFPVLLGDPRRVDVFDLFLSICSRKPV